jgi:hypothetical protein
MIWTVVYWAIVFWTGVIVGYLLKTWLITRFMDYSGTIVVNRDEVREKTVYSLVLDEYPEKLEFKKIVIFKVDSSDENTESQSKH